MSLALIKDDKFLYLVGDGGSFKLPNGDLVSPAYVGWESTDGYSLKAVVDADPIPQGKVSTGKTIEMVAGAPVWVETLADEPAPTSDDVNQERDRRTEAGFMFNGKLYDFDMKAKTNISGAAQLAFIAIITQGASAGNVTWHGGTTPFAWIAKDNSLTIMDAPTVVAFGQAAARHESKMTVDKARALKDLPVIPKDFRDDKYWVD